MAFYGCHKNRIKNIAPWRKRERKFTIIVSKRRNFIAATFIVTILTVRDGRPEFSTSRTMFLNFINLNTLNTKVLFILYSLKTLISLLNYLYNTNKYLT